MPQTINMIKKIFHQKKETELTDVLLKDDELNKKPAIKLNLLSEINEVLALINRKPQKFRSNLANRYHNFVKLFAFALIVGMGDIALLVGIAIAVMEILYRNMVAKLSPQLEAHQFALHSEEKIRKFNKNALEKLWGEDRPLVDGMINEINTKWFNIVTDEKRACLEGDANGTAYSFPINYQANMTCIFTEKSPHPRSDCQVSAIRLCDWSNRLSQVRNLERKYDALITQSNFDINKLETIVENLQRQMYRKYEPISLGFAIAGTIAILSLICYVAYRFNRARNEYLEYKKEHPEDELTIEKLPARLIQVLTRLGFKKEVSTVNEITNLLREERKKLDAKYAFLSGSKCSDAYNHRFLKSADTYLVKRLLTEAKLINDGEEKTQDVALNTKVAIV